MDHYKETESSKMIDELFGTNISKDMKEYDEKREFYNYKIVNKLMKAIHLNPTMRFNQILVNFDFTNTIDSGEYKEEPWDTLERVEKTVKK